MSTFTAVGPALDLDGPLPVAPEHSLLMTEGVLVDRDATRVLNGVNVWSAPTGCPSLWEPCSDGTFRVKDDESEMLTPRFDSFVVYQPITCSAIGLANLEVLSDKIEQTLRATVSAGVERGLAEGVDQSSNPFFGDTNVDDLTGGTAVSPGVGLSMVEDAISATCRKGMIHTTPAVIAALQAFPIGDDSDRRLITANGTPVVSGMGYRDVATSDLPAPGDTEDYIFATGPVQVHLGPIVTTTPRQTLDRSDNSVTFRAEYYVLAYWDTALQAAALVDWAT